MALIIVLAIDANQNLFIDASCRLTGYFNSMHAGRPPCNGQECLWEGEISISIYFNIDIDCYIVIATIYGYSNVGEF